MVLLGVCSMVCRWVVWVVKCCGRFWNSGFCVVCGCSFSLIVLDLCLVGL